MKEKKDNETSSAQAKQRITSDVLAALIIDALIDAKIVLKDDLERAIGIAKEEIDTRKAVGDY